MFSSSKLQCRRSARMALTISSYQLLLALSFQSVQPCADTHTHVLLEDPLLYTPYVAQSPNVTELTHMCDASIVSLWGQAFGGPPPHLVPGMLLLLLYFCLLCLGLTPLRLECCLGTSGLRTACHLFSSLTPLMSYCAAMSPKHLKMCVCLVFIF